MIDFTTVQLNPVPLPIRELQNQNSVLRNQNSLLSDMLVFGGVVLGLIITVEIIHHYENKAISADEKYKMALRKGKAIEGL